jgi:hypothetical protein
LLALRHHVLRPRLTFGAKLGAVRHAVLGLDPVVADLLALGHAFARLHSVVAHLLALDARRPSLTLDARLTFDVLRALALDPGLALDPSRTRLPLHASLALDMLRALAFDRREALLALHALRTLDVERLPRRLTALGRLRALGALRRRALAFNLVGIAVITAWASRSRRGNRQRRDAGSEE